MLSRWLLGFPSESGESIVLTAKSIVLTAKQRTKAGLGLFPSEADRTLVGRMAVALASALCQLKSFVHLRFRVKTNVSIPRDNFVVQFLLVNG